MKNCLLFLIILLFNTIIAQTMDDKKEFLSDEIISIPASTQLNDTITKTIILNDSSQKEWKLGYEQGRLDGNKKSQRGWFWGGCAGGGLGCCIGGGIVWLIAKAKEDKPYIIPERDTAYKAGYLKGYKESSKDEKTLAIIRGGIMGSACLGVSIVSIVIIIIALGGAGILASLVKPKTLRV